MYRILELTAIPDDKTLKAWLTGIAQLPKQDFYLLRDLDRELAPLFAQLPQYVKDDLRLKKPVEWQGYTLFYVPETLFSVTHNGIRRTLYHLAQYFPDKDISDMEIAQLAANELEDALHLMKIYPSKLTSPIGIYDERCMKGWNIPNVADLPEWLMDERAEYLALKNSGYIWNEVYQIGHWDKVYAYDRRSAFPSQFINMLDLRAGVWKQSETYIPDADYAWCDCNLFLKKEAIVHPIIFANPDMSEPHTPTGSWPRTLNKQEIDLIQGKRLGEVEILNGFWWKASTKVMPFEHVVRRTLNYKEYPNPLVQYLAKRMAAGLWGKLIERRNGEYTDYFNPYYADLASTGVKLDVAREIYKQRCWNDLIAVLTDEIALSKPLDKMPEGWKLAYEGEAVFIKPGLIWMGDRHPANLDLDTLKGLVAEHPNKAYYQVAKEDILTLTEATQEHNLKAVGMNKQAYTTIDLFAINPRRIYPRLPKSGHELLTQVYASRPACLDLA
jgi:hypothetical protein